jgi:SpoVK/Ycf46/Vps4 family AAA+-type ATPase
MAKFIKVTQDFRNVTEAVKKVLSPVLMRIKTIRAVENSLDSENKRIIHGENYTTKFVAESVEEIYALIQEAQGAGEVEKEIDIDLDDAISMALESGEVEPGDILQMVKDAVKAEELRLATFCKG